MAPFTQRGLNLKEILQLPPFPLVFLLKIITYAIQKASICFFLPPLNITCLPTRQGGGKGVLPQMYLPQFFINMTLEFEEGECGLSVCDTELGEAKELVSFERSA